MYPLCWKKYNSVQWIKEKFLEKVKKVVDKVDMI